MNVKHITVLSSAAAVVLLSASAAFAQPGIATGAVNVRTGPGTGYAKVGTLSAGELVDVKQCQGSWCFVDRNSGTDGWASANYLKPVDAQPAPSEPDIPFNFGVTVGPGGPSFSFGIGDAPLPPPPAPATPKVCFFKSSNFAGGSFCVSPGDSNPILAGSWNDSISSISVEGGAQVTVCKNFNYGGSCATIITSKSSLSSYNNAISSFQAL
ncbi:MAG TPA: SH3 domain-containing protein [Devosia sp.]|nr:SH3 domain-containing protein [Devosia sp.]